ncbi:hypothetical protein CWC26_14105 [Pseudoalteromonas sp. S4488]|nr:hypothetical protein CWC26_14105 [Pseudoalteromonas sp. S4488]
MQKHVKIVLYLCHLHSLYQSQFHLRFLAQSQQYQSAIILNHFEGLNLSLPALKISDLEQLNNEIFALLSTRFYCLKID